MDGSQDMEDVFSSPSKYQRTFIAKYYGRTLVERWHTQPMLPWIVAEVKRLGNPKSETVFLTVTDTSIKAVNVKYGRTIFEHKISSIIKFAQIASDQKLFAYLTKESSDISLCHVFQASDEDSVFQLFSSLRETVQETAQQKMLQSSGSAIDITPGEGVRTGQCHQYEVLYLGKTKLSQKRAPPTFVDEATSKFHAQQQQSESLATGRELPISEQVIAELETDSVSSTKKAVPGNGLQEDKAPCQNGYPCEKGTNVIVEVSDPLNVRVEQVNDSSCVMGDKDQGTIDPLSSSFQSDTSALDSSEKSQSELLSPPAHSLITHTQSLDAAGRKSVAKDIKAFSFDPDQVTSIIEDGSLRRQTSLPPINSKAFLASGLDFPRLSIDSAASSPEEKPDANRIMLFLIGSSEFCLISTDRKQVFFNKPFSDISHCSQGIKHPEHFGIICREMTLTGMDVYMGYIFQCQSVAVVDDIMKTLKQAFHCALQKSQEKLTSSKSFAFCSTCPLYWFHKLCCDTEGLTPEQIQTTVMLRISSLTQREQKDMMSKFQDMFVHNQEEQNVVFMMLLRALCEQKQMRHSHVFPKDAKQESKGKTGLDSLKFIKKTFPSPFESIFKHTISDAHTLTDLPKEMTLIKTHSLPLSVSRSASKSSLSRVEKSEAGTPQTPSEKPLEPTPPPAATASTATPASAMEVEPPEKKEVTIKEPPTAKQVEPESKRPRPRSKEPSPLATTSKGDSSVLHPNERSLSDTAAIIWELQQGEQQKHCSNASLFTTSDLKINELIQTPLKTTMSPLRNIFLKVGSQSRSSSLKEIKEQQSGSQSASWRKIIFNRVQTPVQRNIAVNVETSKDQMKDLAAEQVKRTSGSVKALWKKAIMEQMILIRMERENKKLQMRQDRSFQKRIKLEYEEICECPKDALQKWEDIMKSKTSSGYEALEEAVKYGVPRQKRGEIWCFLSERYSTRNKSLPVDDTPYMEYLQKLTPYQHSILIDLGRTYPGHKYFSQALGPGQLSLFSILKAYSLMDEEVGYCQGLSFLAGALLLHMAEEKAFQMMKHIMFTLGFRNQYKPDMSALQVQMYQLARLIHDIVPDIHHHFDSLDISPGLYAAPWFLTLFASHFPIGFVSRLLDMVFLQGMDAIFKVAVLLLRTHSSQILNCSTFESVMEFLKDTLPSSGHFGMEKVLEQVLTIHVSKQLQAYQVEYMVLKEEMTQQTAQIEPKRAKTLENDNKELQKMNMELSEQLQVAHNTVKTLEASVTSYQSTVRQLEARVRSLQDERDALHHSVNILRKRLENLESAASATADKSSSQGPPSGSEKAKEYGEKVPPAPAESPKTSSASLVQPKKEAVA